MGSKGRQDMTNLDHRLAGFMQGITKHCYILNMQSVDLMVLDFFSIYTYQLHPGCDQFGNTFFKFFLPILSLCDLIDPLGGASVGPLGLIGRIYIGDHLILIQLNQKAVGLLASVKIYKVFMSMRTLCCPYGN